MLPKREQKTRIRSFAADSGADPWRLSRKPDRDHRDYACCTRGHRGPAGIADATGCRGADGGSLPNRTPSDGHVHPGAADRNPNHEADTDAYANARNTNGHFNADGYRDADAGTG